MKLRKTAAGMCALLSGLMLFGACTSADYTWNIVELGDNVNFHTQIQAEYLALDDYTKISATGMAELSRPEAVKLEWSAEDSTGKLSTIESYVVEISENSNFSGSVSYETSEEFLEIYNLYIATDYYWRVTALLENGKKSVSDKGQFSTEGAAPRNLYVDGVTNVRDLGGWERADGSRVKQGMIYRCGRLNESERTDVKVEITEKGIAAMRDGMGVISEIDLRLVYNNETGGITSSPLGDDVNYYSCPMEWNVGNILTDNKEMVKRVFSLLADEDNYPVIYHCNIGTDRTGLFAFLINGLMGVSEDDLYRDYLFSNFGKINGSRNISGIQNTYIKTVKGYGGETLSEKIENCLIDLGVPAGDLEAIKTLLSES